MRVSRAGAAREPKEAGVRGRGAGEQGCGSGRCSSGSSRFFKKGDDASTGESRGCESAYTQQVTGATAAVGGSCAAAAAADCESSSARAPSASHCERARYMNSRRAQTVSLPLSPLVLVPV